MAHLRFVTSKDSAVAGQESRSESTERRCISFSMNQKPPEHVLHVLETHVAHCCCVLCSTGSVAALSVMTLISVGIGAAFSKVPDALKSSLPVGEMLGVALLVFFGVKALKVGSSVQQPSVRLCTDKY